MPVAPATTARTEPRAPGRRHRPDGSHRARRAPRVRAGNAEASLRRRAGILLDLPQGCAAAEHQAIYGNYTDANKNLKLDLARRHVTRRRQRLTVALNFTIKDAAALNGSRTAIAAVVRAHGSALLRGRVRRRDRHVRQPVSFDASPAAASSRELSTVVSTTAPAITHCRPRRLRPDTPDRLHGYADLGYVAQSAALIDPEGSLRPVQRLRERRLSSRATCDEPYDSDGERRGVRACHGKPYHEARLPRGAVTSLPDFVACKACHYDTRPRSDHDWQQMRRRPATTGPPASSRRQRSKYAYTASLMNDTHMSHAMEFPYPQSMANCNTCHAGKLATIIDDENFTAADLQELPRGRGHRRLGRPEVRRGAGPLTHGAVVGSNVTWTRSRPTARPATRRAVPPTRSASTTPATTR